MALNLVGGICASGYPADHITVSDPHADKLAAFTQLFRIQTQLHNKEAASNADVIILAVKPSTVKDVCRELSSLVKERHPLIISIASGISLEQLAEWLGDKEAIIRVMPNTPSKVLHGISGLCANIHVTKAQRQQTEQLFKAVGITAWVEDEHLLHAITALSGSGPAYHFLFMEAMAEAAVNLGLSRELANTFSVHTALGAAKLAADSHLSLEELRAQVTSPNGTTAKAIQVMEDHHIREIMQKALTAAYDRSIELTAQANEEKS